MADQTPEQRLTEIRAARAALAAEKSKRDADRSVADQLAAEELALKDEQAIACAESEQGPVGKKIATIATDMGVIILKRSHPLLFKKFQDTGSLRHADLDKLVRPCVVYPDASKFDGIIDELPATMLRCANAVSMLAGVRVEEVSGK